MRGLILAAAAAMITGCGGPRGPDPAVDRTDRAAAKGTTVYTCADGFRFSVRAAGDSAIVSLPRRSVTLAGAPAASGTRYAAAGITFWSKGPEAALHDEGTDHSGCTGRIAASPWEAAMMLGVDFRAVGQEPGWVLELDEGHWLRYVGDYGAVTMFAPAPTAQPAGDGGMTYRLRDGARELLATIRELPCQDVMSGQSFSHTVAIRMDEHELRGCGRPLMNGELTERYWKLTELGGKPARTPRHGREAHLRLRAEGGEAGGSTGCNSFGGHYELAGERIRFSRVVSTLMACDDPAINAQEAEFLRMLEAADRAVAVGDDLTLYAGDRVLARFAAVWLR
ncbi:MAG TPA: META domain-containing protein [Gemmatimonadales bacterium]|nr:META domain-containing protein [Gemmatimonadales bacterium]